MLGALAGAALALAAGGAAAAPRVSVEAALAPLTRTLERPIAAYHYATRKKMGIPRPVSPEARASLRGYLRRRIGRYWDLQVPTAPFEMVSGLHLAIDPVITRLFGGVGEDWALVDLVLPRGFRYLDVRPWKTEVPAAWRDALGLLARQGCGAVTPAELLTAMDSGPCRRVATRALAALDVDGILYDYPRASLPLCGPRPGGAFIVLRAQAIDLGAVALHTDEAPAGEVAFARAALVREAFLEARRGGSIRAAPWPSVSWHPDARPRFASWAARHLFGCGAQPLESVLASGAELSAWHRARVRADRTSPWPAYHLAAHLEVTDRTQEALEAYEQALARDATHAESLAGWLRLYLRDPPADPRARVVAAERATRLVSLVYYVPGAARGGWEWPKQRKIEASLLLAAVDARAENWERAHSYAVQATETASHDADAADNPLTRATVSRARTLLHRSRAALGLPARTQHDPEPQP